MKLNQFIELLRTNKEKSLLFEYQEGRYAGANYHITEVKNVAVNSVDCGGKTNVWKETVIQLWESPAELNKKDYMTVEKAVAILDKVDNIHPLWLHTDVKIEYGNADFHTAVLEIYNLNITSDSLIVQLFVPGTLCKASMVCGVKEKEQETACCSASACC